MDQQSIKRYLWHDSINGRVRLAQEELLGLSRPLIILGEAGSGKTTLLEWLAKTPGVARCTANQLVNRSNPATLLGNAKLLVIDALDEVRTQRDGDAVDLVLRRLGDIDCPPFILSCRVADWRSATGTTAISEQYDEGPLELHLEPFSDDDVAEVLTRRLRRKKTSTVIAHLAARGLADLLGNPQTLDLVAQVAEAGELPNSKCELFKRATDLLSIEHNASKHHRLVPSTVALDAAGAAFACFILTGKDGITHGVRGRTCETYIPSAELALLADSDTLGTVVHSRLFKSHGADRFGYMHRRIGEYVGASWLAKLANTPRKRRRLLALFHQQGLVPSSLRGIHAWLARDPALAQEVIATDPMGVIEYGDADDLTREQARTMLSALKDVANVNPRFREWGPYSARGLAQPMLVPELRQLIETGDTPVGLLLLVLEALVGSSIVAELEPNLQALVADPQVAFVNRSASAAALISLGRQDWPATLRILLSAGDEQSVRLAIELMDDIGHEQFDDRLTVDLIIAWARLGSQMSGVLWGLNALPDTRLDGFLDLYAPAVNALGNPYDRPCNYELTSLGYKLITRRLAAGSMTPARLLSWLVPFEVTSGIDEDTNAQLEKLICANDVVRRGVQRLVLLDQSGKEGPYARALQLSHHSRALLPTPDDLIALLGELDPSDSRDERWRDIVQLTAHDKLVGATVRDAARPFALAHPDGPAWLEKLTEPSEWRKAHDRNEAERRRRRDEQQAERQAKSLAHFNTHIEALRLGDPDFLLPLAKAYLGLYSDLGLADVPADARINKWLGAEIDEASKQGFEKFLKSVDPHPTADDIAASAAQSKYWPRASIIVVALAERLRKGLGVEDLDSERIMAGVFELRRGHLDRHAGIPNLSKVIERAIRDRGAWKAAMRRYYEPQLDANFSSGDLHLLLSEDQDQALATELADEWLSRYPNMPARIEQQLIDHLISFKQYDRLRLLSATRDSITDEDRQRDWLAVGILTDFTVTTAKLEEKKPDSALLWHVRDRLFGSRHQNGVSLNVAQLEWLITWFRPLWPVVQPDESGWIGDTNPWDACQHLNHAIRLLGNNTSAEATAALQRIACAEGDGYSELIQTVIAEQRRARVEMSFAPATLETIAAIADDSLPVVAADLQAVIVEELAVAQAKIKSDDADSWRGFYDDQGAPRDEERCRDHLLTILRQGGTGIVFSPEEHVGADKEVDIGCSTGILRMPIEIKGQWHSALWRAADSQLEPQYTRDWRAEGRGIYLVLWFGDQVPKQKRLRSPGKGLTPTTPQEVRQLVITRSRSAQLGHIAVVVMDLSRS